jgi:Lamin Tail Domain
MNKLALLCVLFAGCSYAQTNDPRDFSGYATDLAVLAASQDMGKHTLVDADASGQTLVINEVDPNGTDPLTDPDWVELKNISDVPVNLHDYTMADGSSSSPPLPYAIVEGGAYALILCDGAPDAGAASGIHVPFKLKGGGESVHLIIGGADADETTWPDVPNGQSWARIPDGTGAFQLATPTKLAPNMP